MPGPGNVRRPSFPFIATTQHRPRTNSQPSPEIRFSDWDEENEDDSFDNSDDNSNNDDTDTSMKEEEKVVGGVVGMGGVGVGEFQQQAAVRVTNPKRPLRKARSGSGLERKRGGGRGGMYIDTEHTTHNQPFFTLSGPGHNPQQQPQAPQSPDRSPRMGSPLYHVAHTHSFSQPTSPTYLGPDPSAGVTSASTLGPGPGGGVISASTLGLTSDPRYLSAPVPRGGRIRSNSNPMPFVDVSELWLPDRGRKPLAQPKQEVGGVGAGFPFTGPPHQFDDTNGGQLLNTNNANMAYYNKNYGVKTGE